MVPIVACSILALAIVLERFWTLRASRVAPPQSINELWRWIKKKNRTGRNLKPLQASSPLARILPAGRLKARHGRGVRKERMDTEATKVIHELERFLNPLAT